MADCFHLMSLIQITLGQIAKSFFFSYTGNLVGSLLMVAAVSASGVLAGNAMPAYVAVAKTSLPFGTVSKARPH